MSGDYTFRLNSLHCNSKRSNDDYVDDDFVAFMVTVNGDLYTAQACTPPSVGSIGLVKNGDDIPIGEHNDSWQIGPITINDQDVVSVVYVVSNLSFVEEPDAKAAEAMKIEGGVYGSVAGVLTVVALGLTETVVGAAIAAGFAAMFGVAGAILGVVGEIIGALGSNRHNCDGAVAISPANTFTGASLDAKVNVPVPDQSQLSTFTFVNKHLSQLSPGGCWTPDSDVVWSVVRDVSHQFLPTRPTSMKMLAASRSPKDWEGTWGDGTDVEDCRIRCTIRSSGNGVSGSSASDRVQSYVAGLQHTMAMEPRARGLLGAPARATRPSALAIAALPPAIAAPLPASVAAAASKRVHAVSARYAVDVLEQFSPGGGKIAERFTVANLVEIPVMSAVFASDLYAHLDKTSAGESSGGAALPKSAAGAMAVGSAAITQTTEPHAGAKRATSHTGGVGVSAMTQTTQPHSEAKRVASSVVKLASARTLAIPLPMAATLLASEAVSLELFAQTDDRGILVDHHVRYVRTDARGHVVVDVMLHSVQNRPR